MKEELKKFFEEMRAKIKETKDAQTEVVEKDGETFLRKYVTFEVKEVPNKERTLRFIGSDETVDRMSDVIVSKGWELENYIKNPVFLWAHSYYQPPIGKAVEINLGRKKLVLDIEFADAETFAFADTIYRLYRGGFMRATSVGFKPIKWERRKDDKGEELARGYKILQQELLELSAVPVPANPNALALGYQKGMLTDSDTKLMLENELITEKMAKEIKSELDKIVKKDKPDTSSASLATVTNVVVNDNRDADEADDILKVISFKLNVDDSELIKVGKTIDKLIEKAKQLNELVPSDTDEKATYNCECIKCGHKMKSKKHCKDIKCSKCGGEMRRAERPGPGTRSDVDDEVKETLKNINQTLAGLIGKVKKDGDGKPALPGDKPEDKAKEDSYISGLLDIQKDLKGLAGKKSETNNKE